MAEPRRPVSDEELRAIGDADAADNYRMVLRFRERLLAAGTVEGCYQALFRGTVDLPPLSNRELFRRDCHMCAYCGGEFSYFRLTRDHITPLSRGGRDTWMNVVTACRQCNGHKRNRLLQECGMELLYAPYVPNKAEYLILTNRRILADQMEFLRQHVASHSRLVFNPA